MITQLTINVLTVLEIIAIEFTSIWMLSSRKHSFKAALALYSSITVILILFMCFVAVNLPGYGNGSGGFMLLGVFYFIPAIINYGGEWRSRIIIAFYSFSYGLAIFGIAVRFGYLFGEAELTMAVFIAQTILYTATFPFYLKFSMDMVILYIEKAGRHQKNMMIRYTITSFILIIAYNNTMVGKASMLKKLLVYLLLIYFIILTYRLLVSYLKADDDKQELKEIVRTDRLTKLGNPIALREYIEKLTLAKEPFYLVYLDLNNFKSVNDNYGHSVGDEYLEKFAHSLVECVKEDGVCFRQAGDEFICLTKDGSLIDRIREMEVKSFRDVEYLGVSAGMAMYPDEADSVPKLLELADARMYQQKLKS